LTETEPMSHSYTNLLYHIVFSTKARQPLLDDGIRARLFAYLGGLTRAEGGIALVVNGMPDHVHLLAKLRQDKPISDVIRALKAKSSRWIHKTFPACSGFAWQRGYGVFTVSQSQVPRLTAYIQNQEEHHRRRPFQREFLALLKAHGIEFNELDVWE